MNDEIKLTYLLFSVYLSALCSLGPFGAIWSDLSLALGWGNSYPDPQKPDRAAYRSVEPGRNRSKSKSRTQGKFIVLSIYLLDTCEM